MNDKQRNAPLPDEVQCHVQEQVQQINQARVEIHQLAEGIHQTMPQLHLQAIEESMYKFQLEMRALDIKASVRTFSGEGARKFYVWLKDMNRATALFENSDDRMRALALETIQGSAVGFLAKKIKSNPNIL